MSHAQLTASVRLLVTETFARLDMDVARAVHESILIRQGAYCGRRFDTAGGYAIWFVEEGQIKVFEVGGRMVGVLDLDNDAQARQAQRLAA